jgi:hypothetical protein
MITVEQAARIERGLPTHGHKAAQMRAALKLLSAAPPVRYVDVPADDDGAEEFAAEFSHLWPGVAADRREKIAAAARADQDDDDVYALLYPGES